MFCAAGYFQSWAFMILFDKLACFGILNTHSSEDKEDESDGIHLPPRISELLQGFTWEILSLGTSGGECGRHACFPLLSWGGRPAGFSPASLRQLLESSVTPCGATHLDRVATPAQRTQRMTRKAIMWSPSRKRCDECLHFIASIHCFFCMFVRHSALTVTQT